jgi:hypothetical protein
MTDKRTVNEVRRFDQECAKSFAKRCLALEKLEVTTYCLPYDKDVNSKQDRFNIDPNNSAHTN